MIKLNRSYTILIQTRDQKVLTIRPPFTVHFDVQRKNFGVSNEGSFQIFNLNELTRNSLRHDQYDMLKFQSIEFKAGYIGSYPSNSGTNNASTPEQLATLFKGNITRAYSVREGVDFITHIEALDGGFASIDSKSNVTVAASTPTPLPVVLKQLMDDLKPTVSFGGIGNQYTSLITRPNSYQGSTVDILKELTGDGFYIDNGKAYCLGDSECFLGTLANISADDGLLGTPYLENTFLSFDMLFEPRLLIGQMIFLHSITASDNISDRNYKVVGLRHKGVISGSVSGQAVTTLSCLYGPNGLNVVGATP